MELDATSVVSIIGAAVSFVSAVTAYFIGTKKLYVDIVIKDRLQGIDERRHTLKDLYYYTDPDMIRFAVDNSSKCAHIQHLVKTQSALEYRLLEGLQPEKEILRSARYLVRLAIQFVESGHMEEGYIEIRLKCLELLKIYNFASWEFAQKHSTGRRGSSVHGFDAAYAETLASLVQDKEAVDQMMEHLQPYLIGGDRGPQKGAGE